MQHIFFTGEKGVGKSTLVQALLPKKGTIGGFYTVKSDGTVYLVRPGEELRRENRLFLCRQEADPAPAFDTLGCEALAGECDCIVMDELGPHEEQALAFQAAVFRALDGDTPIIGTLQKADSPFLRRIAMHPGVHLIEVTKENRDGLRRELTGQTIGSVVRHYSTLDSTNEAIKRTAAAGDVPDGLAVIANEQTAGRGRRGRRFLSAPGKGLYLSVFLKPSCAMEQLPTITAWAAAAVRDALEKACGVCAGIKWPNDLLLGGKKLCGILTELVMVPTPGVILGIGINLTQTTADFGEELAPIATSLTQITGNTPDVQRLTEVLLQELDKMYRDFPGEKRSYLRRYREYCLTCGEVQILTEGGARPAVAEQVCDDFSLRVRYPDGSTENLRAGEVSVRSNYPCPGSGK